MNKREKDKKIKDMNAEHALEGIKGNDGDVSNNIDLKMAANTQESQKNNNNNYELCVDSNDIANKGELRIPNIDIEDNKEQDRWDYSNKYNKWQGGESETMTNPNIIECKRTISVMTDLEMMKWQIYFSCLTERTNWTIHEMTKRRKIVRESIRVTNMTNLKLTYIRVSIKWEKDMFV
jgi:hypothetical protein